MKILLSNPGNIPNGHTVLIIDTQEVPLRIILSLIALWGLILSSGCQTNSRAARPPGENHMTPSVPTPADPGLQNLIDKAIADLAQRLAISATQIKLVDATPVVWPDTSLGCPQPGMEYLQVPEDGLLVRLQA